MTPSQLNHLPKAPSPIPSRGMGVGLGLQHRDFQGTQFSPQHPPTPTVRELLLQLCYRGSWGIQ